MSQLLESIRKEMFAATKEGNELIKGIAQLVMAAVKNKEIEKGEALDDEQVVEVIRKEVKKLKDSVDQFTAAGRTDLADESQKQIVYLDKFLPKMMGDDEVKAAVFAVVAEMGVTSVREMGKVMGACMAKLKGQADGNVVKKYVEEALS